MAKQALSPEEIDYLLTAAPTAPAAAPAAASWLAAAPKGDQGREAGPPALRGGAAPDAPEDRRLTGADRHTLYALRRWLQRSCSALAVPLSELLRTETRVALSTVEKTLLGQFVWGRAEPTCFVTLAASENGPPLMLDFSLAVLFPMLERLLGGGTPPSAISRRPLTAIEERLTLRVIRVVADELPRACGAGDGPGLAVRQLAARASVEPLSADTPVACARLEVAFGAVAGPLDMALPWWCAEHPRRLFAVPGTEAADAPDGERRLELVALLAETKLAARDVRDLQVGDIIATEKSAAEPIDVTLDGQLAFQATPGTLDGRKAVRLRE